MNKIDWHKLVELQYWVEGIAGNTAVTPIIDKDSIFFTFFSVLFTSLFAVGIISYFSTRFLNLKNPLISKLKFYGSNFIQMGLLGLVWLLLRQIEVGFLGSRIWLLVGLVWFLTILVLIIRYLIVYYPLEWAYYNKNKNLKNIK
jgi:hypothetical protein